jgi:hypothetical protein
LQLDGLIRKSEMAAKVQLWAKEGYTVLYGHYLKNPDEDHGMLDASDAAIQAATNFLTKGD